MVVDMAAMASKATPLVALDGDQRSLSDGSRGTAAREIAVAVLLRRRCCCVGQRRLSLELGAYARYSGATKLLDDVFALAG